MAGEIMETRGIRYLSVCSGIEAASMAWHPLGWRAVAFAEIEAFPSAALAHHYPEVPNLGDLTRYEEWPEELLAEVDVLVGGTPCQAFSVAGARKSLEDARGNLTLTYARLLDRIDGARRRAGRPAALCLWENVPGVLNTPDNAFGCFLGLLAGEDGPLSPPGGRWTDAGYVRGPGRAIAWRCLDAQYFGLAQRRDRVFVVASAGAVRVEEILFELEGVRRDSPPSRRTGEGAAGNAQCGFEVGGTLGPRVSRLTTDECAQGAAIVAVPTANLIPEVPDTLRSGSSNPASHGKVNGTDRMTLIPVTMAHGQAGAEIGIGIGIGIGTTLSCNHEAPIVFKPEMVAFTENQRNEVREMEVAGALPTIRRGDAKNETLLAVAFRSEMGGNDGGVYEDGCTPTMTSAPPAVAFQERGRKDGRSLEIGGDVAFALTSPNGGGRAQERNVLTPSMSVRRLTPRECERLQGFPDDYTAIPCRGKPAADGPRYKALGNSKAVPVVRWIGRRIEKELTRSHEGTEEKKP